MLRNILLFTAFSTASALAFAGGTNHNVSVDGFSFSPAALTIQAGDTVTFSYAGGGAAHNVASGNGAVTTFRCAVDCTASGGNPTNAAWSSTVTFPTEGSVPFYCQVHGQPTGTGMAGTITVGPVPVELQSFDID